MTRLRTVLAFGLLVGSAVATLACRKSIADVVERIHPSRGAPAELEGTAVVAPNVLMLVFRSGPNRGGDVDDAKWSVKRDGESVAVERVSRHSYPVAQPGYEIGFGKDDDLKDVVVEHRVFLQLAKTIGAKAALQLSDSEGLLPAGAMFEFDDRSSETPVIQLNQVGYHPRATKRWAYVSLWQGTGGALALSGFPKEAEVVWSDGRPTAKLRIAPRAEKDADAGTEVREIDLSSLGDAPGATFRIRIPGVGVSYPSRIDADGVDKAYRTVMQGLLHNRWGVELKKAFSDWPRPADHPFVYTSDRADPFELFKEEQPKTGKRPLVGGYHDAGDFDQRPSHTVVAQLLMRAFELDPAAFGDGELRLPEAGNGIPDLLDEAAWGVRGWLALEEKGGGVRGGVESYRHPWGIYFASDDPLPYFTFGENANVSARVAGIAAQLSRLLGEKDAAKSRELLEAAKRAYAWAKGHGATSAYLLYGASELHRATGDAKFKADFEKHWHAIGPEGAFNRYANEQLELGDYGNEGRVMPDYILGYLTSGDADPAILELARNWMGREADDLATRILRSSHAHRNARRLDEFAWGQAVVMGKYLDPIYARMQLGDLEPGAAQRYLDALSVAADYALGANPAGRVHITGLGKVSPVEPLHLDSLVWRKRGKPPVPGLPVYGPVTSLPGNDWYEPGKKAFTPAFEELPPLLRYADIRTFVVNSEFTVWETQAPSAEHFAMLHAMLDGPPPVALRTTPTPSPSPTSP